ncbi:phosphoenolpyruvate carboxykinase [ATP] 2 [Clostridium polyendosporum]|uniref:Phosphoenolpyruvate carboxykinase (ATP) n=1 Tax=Clostridium polyendosporum TaxID=69208 RepID=A0A919RY47_9CLOT|nr:phosphoenolpyruvate carboxykinase (ATP) [Clostridium polyendosporum]GIM27688.1 phosphoenolpyruvate carboxykinase [ATP] 2 [Clostridium polyendosporum]
MNLDCLNFKGNKKIYRNLPVSDLVELAVKRGEGVLSSSGALVIHTGKYTGRSPKDRFIVKQKSVEDKINWGEINEPLEEIIFDELYNQVINYLCEKDLFVFDGFVGAMNTYRNGVRVISEYASQALFANQMFLRPTSDELDDYQTDFKIICAPGFKARGSLDGINSEAFIIVNFDKKLVLIGGTLYSGEIKKCMFSIMNYILPSRGVFPMHCSANIGVEGDTAVFFGLSGTGKTTLSSDPDRRLIGDDEHGWCDEGIFNFEGGCYAKTIRLSAENEKEIYGAIKFGAVLENVILNKDKTLNYDDDSLTENTRAAYPLHYIDNIEATGIGSQPNTIIFLTADAFGVLPPISKLSKEAAMYHFMSGYTSKLAGTERGIKEPQATFSSCFGEPFMLLNPTVYAKLLGERIEKNNVDVYLVNTGWSGGAYGVGQRVKLSYTRAMVSAALEGNLKDVSYVEDEIFKVQVPTYCPGVPNEILDPKNTWRNKSEYYVKAKELAEKFENNFKKFKNIPENIIQAGPNSDNIQSVQEVAVTNF